MVYTLLVLLNRFCVSLSLLMRDICARWPGRRFTLLMRVTPLCANG